MSAVVEASGIRMALLAGRGGTRAVADAVVSGKADIYVSDTTGQLTIVAPGYSLSLHIPSADTAKRLIEALQRLAEGLAETYGGGG